MNETVLLYHNPHCSKSRAALAWLQQREGIQLQLVDYRTQPPDEAQLRKLLRLLGCDDVRQIMRTQDTLYAELSLGKPGMDQAELMAALRQHPGLLQRPIAVYRRRAAIGRPLENIAALFE